MHTGVSLETCSLVPLTSSWTNACPSFGAPGKEIQSRAAQIEKQMVGEGCMERKGVSLWWVRQWMESFVTVAPCDPDAEQGSTVTSWNLLNCLESQTAVFLLLRLMLKCFLFHGIHQCREVPMTDSVWVVGRHFIWKTTLKYDLLVIITTCTQTNPYFQANTKPTRRTVRPHSAPWGQRLLCLAVVTSN